MRLKARYQGGWPLKLPIGSDFFSDKMLEFTGAVDALSKFGLPSKPRQGDQQAWQLQDVYYLSKQCSMSESALCRDFKDWSKKNVQIVKMLNYVHRMEELGASGWLSDQHIDDYLQIFKRDHPHFDFVKTTTSDFLFCDFRRDNTDKKYQQLFRQFQKKATQLVSEDPDLKSDPYLDKSQFGNRGVKALKELDSDQFSKYLEAGVTQLGVVINTDTCDLSGQHWVCLFIDIQERRVIYFNSIEGSHFEREQAPIKLYAHYIAKQLGGEVELMEDNLQTADGLCGVYCLLVTLLKIHRVPKSRIYNVLKTDYNETIVRQFKKCLFV